MNKGGEQISQFSIQEKLWNSKLIEKLLLTVTVLDIKWFTFKDKPITYIRTFIEVYNQMNSGQVHEMHKIIEFKKM